MDNNFLNNEQVAFLRSQGRIATSPHASHLLAFIISGYVLVSRSLTLQWKSIFSVADISDLKPFLLELFSIVVSSGFLYLGMILFLSLLQTKFYFSASRTFYRKRAFVDFSGIFRVFSFQSLLKLLLLLSLFSLGIYFWFTIAPSSTIQELAEDPLYGLSIFIRTFFKILNYFSVVVVFIALLLILIAKLSFRLNNRLLDKKT